MDSDVVEVVEYLEGLGTPLERFVIESVTPSLGDVAEVCWFEIGEIFHRKLCLSARTAPIKEPRSRNQAE